MKSITLFITLLFTSLSFGQEFFYEVPTKDPKLKKFAKFKVKKIQIKKEGDSLEINYSLPRQLTGFQLGVLKFKGQVQNDKTSVLTGQMGKMKCETESYKCEVDFNKNYQEFLKVMRPVLFAKVIADAKRSRVKKKHLDSKIEVLNQFIDDPKGTFTQNKTQY